MKDVDQKIMEKALNLAKKGSRNVLPNPRVGAMIVANGKIIGQGYHQKYGEAHAEINAIKAVKNKSELKGTTLYVTLEPCRHQGKTGPCWEAIKSVGIGKVIYGSKDPFHGKGTQRRNKDEPKSELLKGEISQKCQKLNAYFFEKRPYLTVKIAMSADGFVAGKNGKAVHFTSPKQDEEVHRLRAEHQAIMVGSNTAINDNPHLGLRHVKGKDPLRIILDSKKRVPKTAQVFRNDHYLHLTAGQPLKKIMQELKAKGIESILVEPGPTLYKVLKKEKLIDELILFKGRKKVKEGLKIEL